MKYVSPEYEAQLNQLAETLRKSKAEAVGQMVLFVVGQKPELVVPDIAGRDILPEVEEA